MCNTEAHTDREAETIETETASDRERAGDEGSLETHSDVTCRALLKLQPPSAPPCLDLERPVTAVVAFHRLRGDECGALRRCGKVGVVNVQAGVVAAPAHMIIIIIVIVASLPLLQRLTSSLLIDLESFKGRRAINTRI